ncbi:MAG: hypothetical protein OEZ68_18130 [Gammaproteobacteria bacterium]|nr:hypothetical protein [Gammaproteobacteria bacterium]MDH5802724.1 hypothetical protein [Gammaproteobacteria bacterium]
MSRSFVSYLSIAAFVVSLVTLGVLFSQENSQSVVPSQHAAPSNTGYSLENGGNNEHYLAIAEKQDQLTDQMMELQARTNHSLEQIRSLIDSLPKTQDLVSYSAKSESTVKTALAPTQTQEEEQLQIQQRFDNLIDEFENQDRDPNWSDSASSAILSIVSSDTFPGTTVGSTECRSTLCFLNFNHESKETMDKFIQDFPSRLGWQQSSGQIQVKSDNGLFSTQIVITRPGHELPQNHNG